MSARERTQTTSHLLTSSSSIFQVMKRISSSRSRKRGERKGRACGGVLVFITSKVPLRCHYINTLLGWWWWWWWSRRQPSAKLCNTSRRIVYTTAVAVSSSSSSSRCCRVAPARSSSRIQRETIVKLLASSTNRPFNSIQTTRSAVAAVAAVMNEHA